MQPLTDEQMKEFTPEGVTVVRNKDVAKSVVEKLLTLTDRCVIVYMRALLF